MTAAVNPSEVGTLDFAVLEVIAGNLDVSDRASLNAELASEVFGHVQDPTILSYDDARLEAVLDALNADYFHAGAADFGDLGAQVTIFGLVATESPGILNDLLAQQQEQDFFSGVLFQNN